MRRRVMISGLLSSTVPSIASAQGLATWLGDRTGLGGVGRALDSAHDQVKKAIPPYGQAETAASQGVQHLSQEALGETAGPALAQLIATSRNDTINAGTDNIPPDIADQLRGYFPDNILDGVRYRVGQGNDLLLAANAFRYGDAIAITLVDVIVFKNGIQPQTDAALWAHELTHVLQYQRWGLGEFAKQYVKHSGDVEAEAYGNSDKFVMWRNSQVTQTGSSQPYGALTAPPGGNICSTPYGRCGMPNLIPIGATCGCPSQWGTIYGFGSR